MQQAAGSLCLPHIGCWARCAAPQVFNLVVSSGINFFDTADSYGKCGTSQTCFNQYLLAT